MKKVLQLLMFIQLCCEALAETSCFNPVCSRLNEDFCYYFGKSSCYQLMCLCSEDCKTAKPFWCVESKNEVQSIAELEKQIPIISMNCNDLRAKCMEQNARSSGHCFFYDKTCLNETWTANRTVEDMDRLYPDLIASKIEKRKRNKKRWQLCGKLKKRCDEHEHLSCRRFDTHCKRVHKLTHHQPKANEGSFNFMFYCFIFFFFNMKLI